MGDFNTLCYWHYKLGQLLDVLLFVGQILPSCFLLEIPTEVIITKWKNTKNVQPSSVLSCYHVTPSEVNYDLVRPGATAS